MGRPVGPIYPHGGGGVVPPGTYPVPDYVPSAPTATPAPPAATPTAPTTPPAASGTVGSLLNPALPTAQYLSEQEQAAILASLGRSGWTIIGGAAVPEVKWGSNAITGAPVASHGGAYTINVKDPEGNTQPVTIFPGNPMADGTKTWIPSATPDTLPKPTSATANTITTADGSIYEKDPSAPNGWKLVSTGKISNPDEDRSKALKAQSDQGEIDARRANQAAGKGYLTDSERITFDQTAERLGYDKAKVAIERDKFALEKLNADAKRQPEIDEIKARTGQLGAQTGLATAQAGQVTSATDIAGRKAGPEIAGIEATTGLAKAQAAIQQQNLKTGAAPDVVPNVGTGQNIYSRDPLTGALSTQINTNYQPKTQAEVAARVGQLQQLAAAKRDELQAKISPSHTPEQATAEWQGWWNANVEGQKQALQAAQEEVQFQRTKDEAAMRTSAYNAAQGAGTITNAAIDAQSKRRVGPGFAEAAQQVLSGKPLSSINIGSALTYEAPDQATEATNAVNQALRYISPGAAQASGQPMPNYGAVDIQGGLNRTSYQPSFGGAPAAPVAAPAGGVAVATAAPPAAPPANDWYGEWQKRQAADAALQQVQAGIGKQVPVAPATPDMWQQFMPNYAPSF